jgi:pimeloyl-ACP methyl ester carboxylesterase
MSMGGAIAQLIALEHPDRVESLTLIATSPLDTDEELPAMSEEAVAEFMAPQPDWSDRAAVIDYGTRLAKASASPARPFEEGEMRALWGKVFDRTVDMAATMTNHNVMGEPDPPAGRLRDVSAPTLVVHGTDDPVLPHPHGVALAKEIPGATLLTLEQMGHELPRPVWDAVIAAIVEHTSED